MKVMVYLGLLSLISMLVVGAYYIIDNSQEDINELVGEGETKISFQGPVPLGYDLEHFIKTGETIKGVNK